MLKNFIERILRTPKSKTREIAIAIASWTGCAEIPDVYPLYWSNATYTVLYIEKYYVYVKVELHSSYGGIISYKVYGNNFCLPCVPSRTADFIYSLKLWDKDEKRNESEQEIAIPWSLYII